MQGFLKLSGSVEILRTSVKASCNRLFTPGTSGRGERVTLVLPPVPPVEWCHEREYRG